MTKNGKGYGIQQALLRLRGTLQKVFHIKSRLQ